MATYTLFCLSLRELYELKKKAVMVNNGRSADVPEFQGKQFLRIFKKNCLKKDVKELLSSCISQAKLKSRKT